MRLFIDPGHGGQDTGTQHDLYTEADYNLEMALKLADLLTPYFDIELSRKTDEQVSLLERGKRAAMFGADRVVSIHCNAHTDRKLRGTSAFYLPGNVDSRIMATGFAANAPLQLRGNAKSLVEVDLKTPGHWTSHARSVLKQYTCPAFLAELFFMSDARDREFAFSERGRDSLLDTLRLAVTAGVE